MTERGATILGFVAASAVPPLLLALRALPMEPNINGIWDALIFLGAAFLVFVPFSALFALVVGTPVFLLLRRFGFVTWWLASIVGGMTGAIAAVAVFPAQSVANELSTFVVIGLIAGTVFWVIWKQGSDDSIA